MNSRLPAEVARLYPFSTYTFVTPGGADMSYVDEGPRTDQAVLFLHGNPTWSFFYRDIIREVGPLQRCIAPDHVGMGLSEKPENYRYTLENRIADIEALVSRLDIKRITLVVHDWGGAIGFGFATRHPAMIARIVILNTAAFASNDIPARIALCRTRALGEFLVRGLNGFAGPASWMAMNRRHLSSAEKQGYLLPYDSWSNRVGVYQFVRDIPLEETHQSRKTLVEIEAQLGLLATVPKLIVWGGKDFCFNDRFLSQWCKIYPDADVHRIPDAGHYILDDGGPEVRRLVTDFITKA